jgi:hypothetical protein
MPRYGDSLATDGAITSQITRLKQLHRTPSKNKSKFQQYKVRSGQLRAQERHEMLSPFVLSVSDGVFFRDQTAELPPRKLNASSSNNSQFSDTSTTTVSLKTLSPQLCSFGREEGYSGFFKRREQLNESGSWLRHCTTSDNGTRKQKKKRLNMRKDKGKGHLLSIPSVDNGVPLFIPVNPPVLPSISPEPMEDQYAEHELHKDSKFRHFMRRNSLNAHHHTEHQLAEHHGKRSNCVVLMVSAPPNPHPQPTFHPTHTRTRTHTRTCTRKHTHAHTHTHTHIMSYCTRHPGSS